MRCDHVIFLALALGLCAGCQSTDYPSLTCKLWTTDTLRNFNEPADKPNTQLFNSTKPRDILVTYNEINESDDRPRRRAFYLQKNFDKLVARRKPHFVNPRKAESLEPVVLVDGATTLPGPSTNATASIRVSGDGRQFTVYGIHGSEPIDVELPTYETASGNTARVLLTPAAVVGDTAVVAAVLGYFAFLVLAHSNWSP